MADRYEVFDITLGIAPPNLTDYATWDLAFRDGIVREIEIMIPDGHLGLTGIQFWYGGVPIIPTTPGAMIVGNNEVVRWPVGVYPTGGRWQARVSTRDEGYAHAFQVRFHIDEFPAPGSAVPEVLPVPIAAGEEPF